MSTDAVADGASNTELMLIPVETGTYKYPVRVVIIPPRDPPKVDVVSSVVTPTAHADLETGQKSPPMSRVLVEQFRAAKEASRQERLTQTSLPVPAAEAATGDVDSD